MKLKTPKVVIVSMAKITPAQETRLFGSIDSYVQGMEREDFVPSPGMSCLSCEYFRECRAWTGGYVERRLAA